MLTHEIDEEIGIEKMAKVTIKMELIARMHKTILGNVKKVQQKQRKTYASRNVSMFCCYKDMVKMKKPNKKKYLEASWEGPYFFVGYANGKDNVEFDEDGCIYTIKEQDEPHRE
jgi:hypothetical protein